MPHSSSGRGLNRVTTHCDCIFFETCLCWILGLGNGGFESKMLNPIAKTNISSVQLTQILPESGKPFPHHPTLVPHQRRCLALGLKALNAGGRLWDAEKQNRSVMLCLLCYTPREVSGGRAVSVTLRFPHKIDPGVCVLDLHADK